MVDLSPLNRLTLKRNMLLQKQLDVQMRIMTEEYRMTKKDLERNSKDLGGFLMYLRDTAPGLSAYGQPDTRAMNAKNIIKYNFTEATDDKEIKKARKALQGQLKKEGGKPTEDETDGKENQERPRSSRNEFVNRRIILDSKRRSFLKNSMTKDSGKPPSGSESREDIRRQGLLTRTGFLSNRDTQGETSSKKRPNTTLNPPTSQRPSTVRYGSEAYSERDEQARKEILNKFDFIFDPHNMKPEGRLRTKGLEATPIAIPKIDGHETNDSPSLSHPSSYILNRRVAWSAPPKRREPPQISNAQLSGHPNRQTMSVTPRSGTAHPNQRCSSAAPVISRNIAGDEEKARRTESHQHQHPNNIDRLQRRGQQRPKTAPQVYQLMQRSVAAPRQQVAGILAEIQSRTAVTRGYLLKSKQLKKMVKSLAPDDVNEDELSD